MSGSTPAADARSAVRTLAEQAANQRGASLVGSDLRLFESSGAVAPSSATTSPASSISPYDLGRTYELMLAPDARRRAGAHLTPAGVAHGLVGLMDAPAAGDHILDPAVGGAAFLLASADRLVNAGAHPQAVLDQLFGIDIDPYAVEVAEAALAIWGLEYELAPRALPRLVVGDGLLDPLPEVDQVVGNPPFLNQLRKSSSHTAARRESLRERWDDLIGTYTDDAWLFLAAGLDALRPSGSVAMVQPVSILAARYAKAVRQHIDDTGRLRALWVARDRVFDAAVQVCGIVAQRQAPSLQHRPLVRAVGADFENHPSVREPVKASGWGSAAAGALGAPAVPLLSHTSGTIGDLADTTAGFRDQFYGFVPHVFNAADDGSLAERSDVAAPLVTVGMIDPLTLAWGRRSFKFAGESYQRPSVDLDALEASNPSLTAWTQARRRPKVLMATQTKVVEVWVDVAGVAIPATPVLSVEPFAADEDMLWRLAAALASPVMSAHFYAAHFGTAMSIHAMKISARDIAAAPLPTDAQPWSHAADLLRAGDHDVDAFGALMCAAYQVDPARLVPWWKQRFPNRTDG